MWILHLFRGVGYPSLWPADSCKEQTWCQKQLFVRSYWWYSFRWYIINLVNISEVSMYTCYFKRSFNLWACFDRNQWFIKLVNAYKYIMVTLSGFIYYWQKIVNILLNSLTEFLTSVIFQILARFLSSNLPT